MKYYSEEVVKRLLENVFYHSLEDCPSIEIPDKHGRLIDADRFIKERRDFYCSICKKSICKTCWVFLMFDETEDAPTLLEATE